MPDSPPAPAGRYAPSPTGELHFGSLVAALASYLQARSRGAAWYVRMEDLDPAREVAGAADSILRTLEQFGLFWDGEVLYQSDRMEAYRDALAHLSAAGAVFACGCTRREARTGPMGEEGPIYPGTCRNGLPPGRTERTLRVRVDAGEWLFEDGVVGPVAQYLSADVGDFVVRRAHGRAAYQLAVVVDDAHQGITEVVRGADLLPSTPRQLLLQSLLGLPRPGYWHVPLLLAADGRKLGKSNGTQPIDAARSGQLLAHALQVLGQQPPSGLAAGGCADVLAWGVRHWDMARVPRVRRMHCT